ncbi:N-acetylneuraminate synthase family protein [Deefgea piscis]|uniref:N-acetylneuraminate synthase family protein n=1 Tax=Deefgea piscis TaxID=2739061 RepID=A0A6M8SV08_9NEIS|nr:N-acetylneuraminate synthase family protein [Deefgea piscis]QKJ67898.1 N-acetylneuraminate synthase family protein [Deefgea piscis]
MISEKNTIKIGEREVGPNCPPFCIAEVGINHNGNIDLAKAMIVAAKEAGADAVKFQTFRAEEFCGDPYQMFTYQSQGENITEPMLDMFKRHEFSDVQWLEIKKYCDEVGITFFSTPQNHSDLMLLLDIGVPAIKIGSDDLTNLQLLRKYAESKKPIILSCGMSDIAEVHQALDAIGWFAGYPLALLVCTSQYPTPSEDVNARRLIALKHAFPNIILGFSDHTQGVLASVVALTLGACIFEKHFTLSHDFVGPDHWFSEEPSELKCWIESIHTAYIMQGEQFVRPSAAELIMRTQARRSIVALENIQAGTILDEKNIGLRRPGDGLPPNFLELVIGKKARKSIQLGNKINIDDLLL